MSDPKRKEPAQLKLDFDRQYSDIQLKEAVRALKAIAKECVRLGMDSKGFGHVIKTLVIWNPIIREAAGAIDEAIAD